ncbi:hypothetical protein FJV76_23850 [Mesorhizobium sp. WSM4303]|nr:hypothetical protein FJV77_14170 [Mesorhizobium sp. WSM4306]TRC99918.1 hypothetical protein FJV76_23850 [Mesorhizobium sp. WSM4303]
MIGRGTHAVVIHGRSKERSDAAQTRGSIPCRLCDATVQVLLRRVHGQGPGMDPWVSATELRSCFAQG